MYRAAIALVLSACAIAAGAAEPRLQGDAEAVALVERMLERLGGRTVWARTRTLHLVYHGWRTEPDEPVIERAWRDLSRPMERVEFEGRSFQFIRVFTGEGGWRSLDGEVAPLPEEQLRASHAFWPRDFYTVLHRFAVADPDLRLEFIAPRRVAVRSGDGEALCWWEIDATGQPLRWGAQDGDEALEYVYLPVRSFGNIDFPAGGAATDGFWRFEYVTVDVSPQPIPVPLEMPGEAGGRP